jgi:hypothetical protein
MRTQHMRLAALEGVSEVSHAVLSVIRALLLGALSLLEPVMVWICSTISAGAVVMAAFYRLAAPAGHFPYAVTLGIGLSSLGVLSLYYVLLACLSED